jgi:hypothetical protein
MSTYDDWDKAMSEAAMTLGLHQINARRKAQAHLKELKDSPEYKAWQDKTIYAAIRGENPPSMPNTLLEAIERKQMEKRK